MIHLELLQVSFDRTMVDDIVLLHPFAIVISCLTLYHCCGISCRLLFTRQSLAGHSRFNGKYSHSIARQTPQGILIKLMNAQIGLFPVIIGSDKMIPVVVHGESSSWTYGIRWPRRGGQDVRVRSSICM